MVGNEEQKIPARLGRGWWKRRVMAGHVRGFDLEVAGGLGLWEGLMTVLEVREFWASGVRRRAHEPCMSSNG